MKHATKLRALAFIATHPGTRHKAVFSHRYRFDAPELERAPFRLTTIQDLIAEGLVDVKPDSSSAHQELVTISERGKALLVAKET